VNDFGEDFLGRSLAACLITGADYVRAQRERRRVLAEMKPVYERFDVLITAGPSAAPRLDSMRTIHFWQKASLVTPFNVTAGPALSQCIGFTRGGLPLSWQIVGRPFDDATVMRVADAYERETPWRSVRPTLTPGAGPLPLPPVPDPEPADCSPAERDRIAMICKKAGLVLNERVFEQLGALCRSHDGEPARRFGMVGRAEHDLRSLNDDPPHGRSVTENTAQGGVRPDRVGAAPGIGDPAAAPPPVTDTRLAGETASPTFRNQKGNP
jgi:hypothetical protein